VTNERHVDLAAVDLYGMIERLVDREPQQAEETAAPGAGVADNHDALAAVRELAEAIHKPAETGDLDPEHAHRMASLLLVIRDYLEPFPTEQEDDRVVRYVAEVVDKLRR
jgi:hypothetical protein